MSFKFQSHGVTPAPPASLPMGASPDDILAGCLVLPPVQATFSSWVKIPFPARGSEVEQTIKSAAVQWIACSNAGGYQLATAVIRVGWAQYFAAGLHDPSGALVANAVYQSTPHSVAGPAPHLTQPAGVSAPSCPSGYAPNGQGGCDPINPDIWGMGPGPANGPANVPVHGSSPTAGLKPIKAPHLTQPAGVAVPPGIAPPPSIGDVNPRCFANKYFVDEAMQGDYWTTYGSQDSEQRTYNANWVHNMLGVSAPRPPWSNSDLTPPAAPWIGPPPSTPSGVHTNGWEKVEQGSAGSAHGIINAATEPTDPTLFQGAPEISLGGPWKWRQQYFDAESSPALPASQGWFGLMYQGTFNSNSNADAGNSSLWFWDGGYPTVPACPSGGYSYSGAPPSWLDPYTVLVVFYKRTDGLFVGQGAGHPAPPGAVAVSYCSSQPPAGGGGGSGASGGSPLQNLSPIKSGHLIQPQGISAAPTRIGGNMLGLNGAHGVGRGIEGCGCKSCERAQAAAQAPAQSAANQAVAAVNAANAAPCPEPPIVADVLIVTTTPKVAQTPCDTRWQQEDYPPTEGPTDADIRCAGCWWVGQVVPQGVGESMEGIMRGGHQVQGFGQPAAPQPAAQSPSTPTGLAAPFPRGLGLPQGLGATTNPSATSPATVGVVAALGGTVGLLVGAAIGLEIGQSYSVGGVTERRAAVGGLLGMLVGSFTGAAIVAPSIQAQQA